MGVGRTQDLIRSDRPTHPRRDALVDDRQGRARAKRHEGHDVRRRKTTRNDVNGGRGRGGAGWQLGSSDAMTCNRTAPAQHIVQRPARAYQQCLPLRRPVVGAGCALDPCCRVVARASERATPAQAKGTAEREPEAGLRGELPCPNTDPARASFDVPCARGWARTRGRTHVRKRAPRCSWFGAPRCVVSYRTRQVSFVSENAAGVLACLKRAALCLKTRRNKNGRFLAWRY